MRTCCGSDGGELPAELRQRVAETHLQHLDCRADNVIIDIEGAAWIIDWPWAGIGARWIDGVCYLLDARMRAEDIDTEALLHTHPLFHDVASDDVDSLLSALAGGFLVKSRLPVPANMPGIRDFQRREGFAAIDWLRERWGG